MANAFTGRQYQEVKNKRYVLESFENGKRVFTHSGLSMYEAMRIVIQQSSIGRYVQIRDDENYDENGNYIGKRGQQDGSH